MTFLSIIWGSSFILIKKALLVFSPMQIGCLRIAISAIAFTPFVIYQFKTIDWRRWKYFIVVATCGSGIPAFLYPFAQLKLDSAVVGILNSLVPIFTLILGMVFFKYKGGILNLVGVLIGFGGVSLLFIGGQDANTPLYWFPTILAILASLCYATSVNTIKSHLGDISPLTISTVSFSMAGIPAIILFFQTEPSSLVIDNSFWNAVIAVTVLSLLGTFLASVVFFKMVQRTDAVFGSLVAYFIPIIAVLWGVWDGETISIYHLIGLFLIIGGVALVKRK